MNADAPVETQIFHDAPSFDFFQATRLLRLQAYQRGQSASRLSESIRFRTNPSLEFPASAVRELWQSDAPNGPPVMTVNFLGLHGASGVLPRHYSELIHRLERERRDRERSALRDWFDLFNHRFIALFYEAWEKYRFWLAAERGAWSAAEPDPFTLCLLSLIGLGSGGMRNRLQIRAPGPDRRPETLAEIRDLTLLRYAGLLAQRKRNVLGLEQLLGDHFGCAVRVLQFQGRWLPLSQECQTQLGEDPLTCELGTNTLVGDQVWDVESTVRIRIGPLNYEQFLELFPDTSARPQCKTVFLLNQLTRFYLGPHLDWDIQLILQGEDVPECQLGEGTPGPRLGWNVWLSRDRRDGDARDAIFTSDECSWPATAEFGGVPLTGRSPSSSGHRGIADSEGEFHGDLQFAR